MSHLLSVILLVVGVLLVLSAPFDRLAHRRFSDSLLLPASELLEQEDMAEPQKAAMIRKSMDGVSELAGDLDLLIGAFLVVIAGFVFIAETRRRVRSEGGEKLRIE